MASKDDAMNVDYDVSQPQVMFQFYKRLYPYQAIFHWLNQDHAPSRLFTHREFAFTLQGDVYLRYQSFATAEEFQREVCRRSPTRFEIGAIYNARPKDKKVMRPGALQPQRRELVFDIDMTDYDSVRTCCTDKKICARCWGFIAAAVRVLDSGLRNQFGYRQLLWVYSGRRGIHCWVSDAAAMDLTDDQRRALMAWLEVVKGSKDTAKKVNVRFKNGELHPALSSAVRILNPKEGDPATRWNFDGLILHDQDCFKNQEQWEDLLKLLGNADIADSLRKTWQSDTERTSRRKWEDLVKELRKRDKKTQSSVLHAMEEIILQYMYPRLDMEVSKHRNHLLKAPFCVHPSTGRVCVPVDPATVDDFDPERVPTVGQLLSELDRLDGVPGGWEKTSLKPYVEMLERHAQGIIQEARQGRKAAQSLEF
ncbi:DNA primase catalytic subunit [Exidia glandulosa HHB12029]|uniref:DNA primase n=1 Tax=Exidia glandulosa HHB12029 TaxID=1314781 RepID=A0A165F0T0_EXIGL|nr:DNA primase catalytic subunit [Exidia glandulosa HHB12029]